LEEEIPAAFDIFKGTQKNFKSEVSGKASNGKAHLCQWLSFDACEALWKEVLPDLPWGEMVESVGESNGERVRPPTMPDITRAFEFALGALPKMHPLHGVRVEYENHFYGKDARPTQRKEIRFQYNDWKPVVLR
jgi:hypothetical protein